MCDEFEDPRCRRKKTAKQMRDRIVVAEKFDIPYVPNVGRELEVMPRTLVTPCVRHARPPTELFKTISPKGTMHGVHSTSTNAKKCCTYDHAVLHFPASGTLPEQLRNLDTVLYVCTDDFSFRRGARPSTYQDASDRAFTLDTGRILDKYAKLLQTASVDGYDVGPHLDHLRRYAEWYELARQEFLSASERKRPLQYHSATKEVTPVKMRAFD
jgi:hypothetical protein